MNKWAKSEKRETIYFSLYLSVSIPLNPISILISVPMEVRKGETLKHHFIFFSIPLYNLVWVQKFLLWEKFKQFLLDFWNLNWETDILAIYNLPCATESVTNLLSSQSILDTYYVYLQYKEK